MHSSQGLTGHSTQCQRETHRAKVQNKKTWPGKQPPYHGSCVKKIRNMTNVLRTFLHPACRNQNMRQLLSTCLLLASLPFFRMRRRPCFHISQQAAGATNLGVSTEKKRCAWLCTLDPQKSRHKSNQCSSNTCKMQLTISLYIYIYIHIYIHVYTHINIYTYIDICIHRF